MPEDNKIKENRSRIINLENDVGNLKVETGKISVNLEHGEKRACDRHEVTKTAQLEIKNILQRRVELDKEREEEARKYRESREQAEREANLSKQKWVRSLLNPQTLIIILAVLLSIFGIRIADVLEVAPGLVPSAPSSETP